MDQITYARIALKEKYQTIRDKNSYFSFRAYARRLGIAVSTYSNFIAQKADIGPELLNKVMQKALSEEEYKTFLDLTYKKAPVLEFSSVAELRTLDETGSFKGLYRKEAQDDYFVFASETSLAQIEKAVNDLIIGISQILTRQDPLEEKRLYQLAISAPRELKPQVPRDQRLCKNL